MVIVIAGLLAVFRVFSTAEPPNFDCDPGPRAEEKITAYRTLTFGVATALAVALGALACAWSLARRERSGQTARPGILTIMAVAVPPFLFATALIDPENFVGFSYFAYVGLCGVAAVPALTLAALVISAAGERWIGPPERAERVETLTS
jgi:ABC-type Fe3+ transport system permease subunit